MGARGQRGACEVPGGDPGGVRGRVPRVLDPFAEGGAIPLEAMRLGCEAVEADINPVAWFILHCTLHYPRLLAGEARPLPSFALDDRVLVEEFLKARGVTKANVVREEFAPYEHGDGETVQVAAPLGSASAFPAAGADFAWHLRAWGRRVLAGRGGLWRRAVRRMRSSSRCGARGAGGSLRPFRCRRCATPASAAEAARNGRGRPSVGGFVQRGIRFLPSGERGESALGGEAGE